MKISMRQWEAEDGKVRRFYAKNAKDGNDLGFIEMAFRASSPDPATNYGRHRIAKGEGECLIEDRSSLRLVGDQASLSLIIRLAEKTQTSLSNALGLLCENSVICHPWGRKAKRDTRGPKSFNVEVAA